MKHFICQDVFSEMKRTTQWENNNSNFYSEKDTTIIALTRGAIPRAPL